MILERGSHEGALLPRRLDQSDLPGPLRGHVSEVPGRPGPSTLRRPPLRSHSVGVFIRYFVNLPVPFKDAEARILAAPEVWAPGVARDAEDGGEHLLAEVGFLDDHRVGKESPDRAGNPLPYPVQDHSAAYVDGLRTGETVPVPRCGLGDRGPGTKPHPALDQRRPVPAAF
jgi:hypothetical protein